MPRRRWRLQSRFDTVRSSSAFQFPKSASLVRRWSANALAHRRATQCTQVELQHDRMVSLNISAVRVICNVVQAQDHAIVDIAKPKSRLIEFSGNDVVACRGQHNPIRVELDLSSPKDALLSIKDAKGWLGGIVAVKYATAPTIEVGASLEFNSLRSEGVIVKAEPRGEHVNVVRLIRQPRDVVGPRRVQTTVETRVGCPAECKGILAKHIVRLAKQCVDKSALVELGGVLHTVIGAAAAFDPIPA